MWYCPICDHKKGFPPSGVIFKCKSCKNPLRISVYHDNLKGTLFGLLFSPTIIIAVWLSPVYLKIAAIFFFTFGTIKLSKIVVVGKEEVEASLKKRYQFQKFIS